MQIPKPLQDAWAATLDWVVGYGQPLLFGAGVVAALLALALIWRFLRTGEVHERLGTVAVTLATLFAMEGMYEVANGPLGLNVPGSLMFCATFEVVMLHQGSLAAHKLAAAADGPAPDISRHMKFVWLVAVTSGVIASTASSSVTEVVLRLATPPLAAGIWYMSLYADVETAERQPSRWIWTPQRIGVRLGLLKPGTVDDLTEVFQQRRIAALVDAGMELYVQQQAARLNGAPDKTSRWPWRRRDQLADALRRLQHLTRAADAETVRAAREQLRRVLSIETELFRDDTQADQSERRAMDDLRLGMRIATTSLGRQADQMREVAGIRMPASIADQIPDHIPAGWMDQHRTSRTDHIRTSLADQTPAIERTSHVDQERTSHVDQERTSPTGPDQTATRGAVPATRSTPAQRTTARVDRVRPVSPAAGGEVPPKVREMARALAKKFRGEIPARAEVMRVMGWSSADYTGKAINLVRTERAERTKKED
ncbi:hypothetical protein EYA84_01925 [Verrucosispora sp. SN26_14.1]|uniref:hypothetical protein n=1 Tax=Verrucosispora sp. SN26_14.1 TaxID=2527879 RepID=UPI00103353B6|nr:hypothetical protein [Verrucosispora sp. SN26_14.1]TBL44223.1 hypothetical protein EYA84_01925 [Verrucosispora sp. SN26_14.1]